MATFHLKSQQAFLDLLDIKASYDDLLELMSDDEPSKRFFLMIGERFEDFLKNSILNLDNSIN